MKKILFYISYLYFDYQNEILSISLLRVLFCSLQDCYRSQVPWKINLENLFAAHSFRIILPEGEIS